MRDTGVDLTAAEVVADPCPFLAEERSRAAVAWHERDGTYLTFDHPSASAVLRDRPLSRLGRDREPVDRLEPFNGLHRDQTMENEPPVHILLLRRMPRLALAGEPLSRGTFVLRGYRSVAVVS
jgi:hypothetical protein